MLFVSFSYHQHNRIAAKALLKDCGTLLSLLQQQLFFRLGYQSLRPVSRYIQKIMIKEIAEYVPHCSKYITTYKFHAQPSASII
ncbi:hypothetical protein AYI70_g8691 [Smittium culicis]|uniref:Uncharacterized protein n=1 Tax=Smittium culicis TaxID=133412 RepID=A0A1R1XEV0_9FUNG|nr:hypothetical protein AYI70_g8691 [Smittium culicis]